VLHSDLSTHWVLSVSWGCLHYRAHAASEHVWTTVACDALWLFLHLDVSTRGPELHLDVYSTEYHVACGLVSSAGACAAPTSRRDYIVFSLILQGFNESCCIALILRRVGIIQLVFSSLHSFLQYFWKISRVLRFDLFKFLNKQCSLRFNLSTVWNKQSSLRFYLSYSIYGISRDPFTLINKGSSLCFDFLKIWNKQASFGFDIKYLPRLKLGFANFWYRWHCYCQLWYID
jgi:hypothetical protein